RHPRPPPSGTRLRGGRAQGPDRGLGPRRDEAVPGREGRGQAVLAGAAGSLRRTAAHGQRKNPEVRDPRPGEGTVMTTAYLVAGVRTPIGLYGGGLAAVRPDDLAVHVIGALVDRLP